MAYDERPEINLPPHWAAFLGELDRRLPEVISIHCVGGFAMTVLYGLPRATSELDCVAILPNYDLEAIAGRGSAMAQRFGIFLQYYPAITMPEDYAARMTELFPGRFHNLRIFVPDPYDLILSKLERN